MKCTLLSIQRLLQIHVWQKTSSWYFRELLSTSVYKFYPCLWSGLSSPDAVFFSLQNMLLVFCLLFCRQTVPGMKKEIVCNRNTSLSLEITRMSLCMKKKLGFFFSLECVLCHLIWTELEMDWMREKMSDACCTIMSLSCNRRQGREREEVLD